MTVNPDEVVALGAAVQAAVMKGEVNFPVGAASGARAKSLSASQDDGEKAGKGL